MPPNNRQARHYRLTAAGRRALDKEVESWKKFAAAGCRAGYDMKRPADHAVGVRR